MEMQSAANAILSRIDKFKIDNTSIPGEHLLPHSSGFHYHDVGELLIVKRGKSSIFIGEDVYSVEGSYLVYFQKGISHCSVALPKHEYSRFCVSIDEHYFSRDVKLPKKSFVLTLSSEELDNLLASTELLYSYFANDPRNTPIMVKRREHLLELLVDEINELLASKKDSIEEVCESYITKICEYLSLHYNESITLSKLSDSFFVSKAKLTKDFRNKCGVSICDFITTLRLRSAKKFLSTTNLPIWSIAEKCGYQSSGYFIRQFTKLMGMTPVQYRKMTDDL